MSYTEICNAPWLYIWVGVLLIGVIVQCVIFMRKAWRRARGLGMTDVQIRKALTTGISISVFPTIPVLIVFLALVPLLGVPLPWLRLSVIGSAAYESYAASIGAQAVGEELVVGGYSTMGWIAAAWVMTVGGSACVIYAACAIKPITMLYKKAEAIDMKLVTCLGTGCMLGVMAYVSVSQGLSAVSTKGVVFGISFVCSALMVLLRKKVASLKWLGDYQMAISMVIAMIAACVIF